MSNEKQIKARVQLKADSDANWDKATGFSPLEREPIFYTTSGGIKFGDGSTPVTQLPFFNHRIFVAGTEPTDAQIGDIWIDTTETTTLYTAEEANF